MKATIIPIFPTPIYRETYDNNLVELQKNVFHSTTPTSLLADIRVTIQIFWNVSN